MGSLITVHFLVSERECFKEFLILYPGFSEHGGGLTSVSSNLRLTRM